MSSIPNSIASNAEVSRGVSALYAQLREDMQKNGSEIHGGFSKAFTSADGLVTITLSTEGISKAGEMGLHLKSIVRSGSGPDSVTAESNASSDAVADLDDVSAHEASMQSNFAITQFSDTRGQESAESLLQADESLAGKAARISISAPDAAQAKRQATDQLIDTLTAYLQGLKENQSPAPKSLTSEFTASAGSLKDKVRMAESLLIRIDVNA